MRHAPALIGCALLALPFVGQCSADADVFGPSELVSQGFLPSAGAEATVQASYAHDPVISLDGRYVAFDGSFAGLAGVWRRDLQTGEIRAVAIGRPLAPGSRLCESTASSELGASVSSPCDALLPSISENGQYVSFTTDAPLARHDDLNVQPDVYVRNMNVEESALESDACEAAEDDDSAEVVQQCPFTLVSAVNGSDVGLAYAEEPTHGALAEGRSAISASGQQVAFVTTAVSDLAGSDTPAMQVAVRDLASRETKLVSTRYDASSNEAIPDDPVSGSTGEKLYGAVYDLGTPPGFPLASGSHTLTRPVGASISADGTTVAWLGVDVNQQARTLPGELSSESYKPEYAEPLWRRIDEGPGVPTRRITGGSDPESPGCVASGEQTLPGTPSSLDPCQGPFETNSSEGDLGVWGGGEEGADFVPQLSADGYTVAFLATAPLVALGNDFGLGVEARHPDVYVANMHPGVSRTQALRPLSELASGNEQAIATNAPIIDLAISADGTQVAFTTKRTEFPLDVPAFVSVPAAIPGLSEVFDADLADETLTRVSEGFEGGASAHPHGEARSNEDPYPIEDDGGLSPSFSADGDTLAFSSTASNLAYGDGNTPAKEEGGPFDGGDAFVVHREVFTPIPTPQYISSPPAAPAPDVSWTLGSTALSLRSGAVRLYVEVPGRGTLGASARGLVIVRVRSTLSRRHGSRGSGATHATLVTRTLASASKLIAAPEGELVMLTLTLTPRYRALAFARDGISASVLLSFTSAGHPAVHESVPVLFAGVRPRSRSAHVGSAKRTSSKLDHSSRR